MYCLQLIDEAVSKRESASRKLKFEVAHGRSVSVRLHPHLAQLHGKIMVLESGKAVADAQASALENLLLRTSRSECDVSFFTLYPFVYLIGNFCWKLNVEIAPLLVFPFL
jgi:hypothetical protein